MFALLSYRYDLYISTSKSRKHNKKKGIKIKVHIKLDTGMNRIGVEKNRAVDFIRRVQQNKAIELQGIFTHFACSEVEEKTNEQIKLTKEKYQKLLYITIIYIKLRH